jgi:hypothetical protein
MAARKKSAKKKTARKKTRTARQAFDDNLKALQKRLSPSAARRVRDLRDTVRDLERQADKARADAEKRLQRAEIQIRKDAVKVLRRIEHAIEPPKRKRKKKGRRGGGRGGLGRSPITRATSFEDRSNKPGFGVTSG